MAKVKEAATSRLSESQIKTAFAAIDEARQREEADLRKARFAGRERIKNNRWDAEKRLTAFLKKSGIDVEELEKASAQSRSEARRFLKDQLTEDVRHSSAVTDSLRQSVESRRQTVERFVQGEFQVAPPLAPTSVVAIDTPFIIFATSGLISDNTHIEPWNNVAKIRAFWEGKQGNDNVRFIFVWTNPSDRFAVVNVDSSLLLTGSCDLFVGGGIFSGETSHLIVTASLGILEWWNQPPTSPPFQGIQQQRPLFLEAEGGGGWVGDVVSENVYGDYDLRYNLFVVPGNGVVVFEVKLSFDYNYSSGDSGDVQINFFSGFNRVMCPSVVLDILS